MLQLLSTTGSSEMQTGCVSRRGKVSRCYLNVSEASAVCAEFLTMLKSSSALNLLSCQLPAQASR